MTAVVPAVPESDENDLILRMFSARAVVITRRALLSRGAKREADLIQAQKWSDRDDC